MLNFSRLRSTSLIGWLLRVPLRLLRLLPHGTKVWIIQGPLRGYRWILASAVHGCWLGTYELENQKRIIQALRPGDIFFDLGANAGFFTLLAAKLVGESGKVFAFEPLPSNYNFLMHHIEMNGVHNVVVFKVAVCDSSGTATFEQTHSDVAGHLSQCGGILVETVTLDELYAAGKIQLPECMKIDVEGAELLVLKGARRVLTKGTPTLMIETHGERVHQDCLELLRELGYQCKSLNNLILAMKP